MVVLLLVLPCGGAVGDSASGSDDDFGDVSGGGSGGGSDNDFGGIFGGGSCEGSVGGSGNESGVSFC